MRGIKIVSVKCAKEQENSVRSENNVPREDDLIIHSSYCVFDTVFFSCLLMIGVLNIRFKGWQVAIVAMSIDAGGL